MRPWLWPLAALLVLAGGRADAGPLEARALWEEARATAGAPWPTRVRALRAVVCASRPTDSVHTRALAAIAVTLKKANLVHGAAAFEARAARRGPRRGRRRIDAELRLARLLRRELDLTAARTHLEAVASDGRRVAWRSAEQALTCLAEDAFDTKDVTRLARIHERLRRARSRPHVRLETLGWLGLLYLGAGDRPRAERTYGTARRLYEQAVRGEDKEAIRCSKLWLDYPLRGALRAARGE